MDLRTTPLHKICVDKSSCLAKKSENHKATAELTKDALWKEYISSLQAK